MRSTRMAAVVTALSLGAVLVPATGATADAACTQLQGAPLTETVLALGNAAKHEVRAEAGNRYAPSLGTLSAGIEYRASAPVECSDGFAVQQRKVELGGQVGFVNAAATATVPQGPFAFDREVVAAGGLITGSIKNAPASGAEAIASLQAAPTTYTVTTATYTGSSLAGIASAWLAVDLGGGRVGFVEARLVVDAASVDAVDLVDVVVRGDLGVGMPVLTPLVEPDSLAGELGNPLAGKGHEIAELRAGQVFEAVPTLFKGIDLSLLGVFAGALAERELGTEDAARLPYWRLIRYNDAWAWVPAIAVSEDPGMIAKAKELAQEAKDRAAELLDAAKNRGAQLIDGVRDEAGEKAAVFSMWALIPAGFVAGGSLLLLAFAVTRRFGMLNPLRRAVGTVALVAAPAMAAAVFWALPVGAPVWAWLGAVGLLVLAALPLGLVVYRVVKQVNARLIAKERGALMEVPTEVAPGLLADIESGES